LILGDSDGIDEMSGMMPSKLIMIVNFIDPNQMMGQPGME